MASPLPRQSPHPLYSTGSSRRFSMKLLPKTGFVLITALFALSAQAQETGTLKKIKDSGTITLGARESSGALAYTLGDGKYVGFHTEMSEKIAARHQEPAQDAQARHQVPAGDVAEPHSAGAERHGGPGVRLDDQQRGAAEGRGVRDDDLRRGRPHRGQGRIADQGDRRSQRQDGRDDDRNDVGADAAQEQEGRQHGFQGSVSARTTPTASCCSSPAAPTRS